MAPAEGAAGGAHGFVPGWQTCPIEELPLAMPFTNHDTLVSEVFETVAANVTRRPVATVTDVGETAMPTLPATVTLAETTCALPDSGLNVACIVTGFVTGSVAGAVYSALLAPVTAIVPSAELPFAAPFTSHVIVPLPLPQNVAAKLWLCAKARVTAAGEIEFVVAQTMVTVALADFVESATLVAVTVTFAGEGGKTGAV